MPSSRYDHIPTVLNVVQQLSPASVLDVGVGFGKWGHLFREYLEIVKSEEEPARYRRENWRIRIDGIEGYAPYVTAAHEYFYDRIHLGDMRRVIDDLDTYDLIFLGDVIEHIPKDEGHGFLHRCLAHARMGVIVSTPASETEQGILCDNPLEVHRSLWSLADFQAITRTIGTVTLDDVVVAVLLKDGVAAPYLGHRPPPRGLLARIPSFFQSLARRVGRTQGPSPSRRGPAT